MEIIQDPEKGNWNERKTPDEIIRDKARKIMGLDEKEFPLIGQEEAYIRMKTDPKLRREINKEYLKTFKRPATDAEYDMVLKNVLGMTSKNEKGKRPVTENPPPVQYGDWRDISWQ